MKKSSNDQANPQPRMQRDYWRKNLLVTLGLLAIWFVVTFGASYFARELNQLSLFGFPFGFYLAAQGAPLIYVCIVGFYALYMNRLDRRCLKSKTVRAKSGLKEFLSACLRCK